MRTQYRCPVDGCDGVYETANELRGHMAGMMQYDAAHRWRNVPISHDGLGAAAEKVPGGGIS